MTPCRLCLFFCLSLQEEERSGDEEKTLTQIYKEQHEAMKAKQAAKRAAQQEAKPGKKAAKPKKNQASPTLTPS